MIEDSYPFTYLCNTKPDLEGIEGISLYHFKSSKSHLLYIVRVEKYRHSTYGVKFYLKNHSASENKYKLLTNTHEPRKIVYTCINIMLSIYEKDKLASFGFIGSGYINEENKDEPTKRFKFYSRIIATLFSDDFFQHKENLRKSTYLLINKVNLQIYPSLIEDIENFFVKNYNNFD